MSLSKNDWIVWLKGLIGAGISGGTAAISTMVVAPETFNLQAGIHKLWIVAVASFVISIAKYLQSKPFPEDLPEQ